MSSRKILMPKRIGIRNNKPCCFKKLLDCFKKPTLTCLSILFVKKHLILLAVNLFHDVLELWYILDASKRIASIRSWLIKKTNFRPAISRTELFANFTEDPLRI